MAKSKIDRDLRKAYTKYRDIAVKRNKRAVAKGLSPAITFPTIKELSTGGDFLGALRRVKDFVERPTTIRHFDPSVIAEYVIPEIPKPKRKRKPLTEAQRVRKNERNRLYRQRKAVKEYGESIKAGKGEKFATVIKALDSMRKAWDRVGFDPGFDLELLVMTPEKAKAFAAYIDYRFSQGDYKRTYAIDIFTQDFGKIVQRGYSPDKIIHDFDIFLSKQAEIEGRKNKMENYGYTAAEFDDLWERFYKG